MVVYIILAGERLTLVVIMLLGGLKCYMSKQSICMYYVPCLLLESFTSSSISWLQIHTDSMAHSTVDQCYLMKMQLNILAEYVSKTSF